MRLLKMLQRRQALGRLVVTLIELVVLQEDSTGFPRTPSMPWMFMTSRRPPPLQGNAPEILA
jgi:hypothetical protein